MYNKEMYIMYNLIKLLLSILAIIFSVFSTIIIYNSINQTRLIFSVNGLLNAPFILFSSSTIVLLLIIYLLCRIKKRYDKQKERIQGNAEKKIKTESIDMLLKILEKHDPYTKGHSQSVAKLASEFAGFFGMSEEKIHDIYLAGLVHDLGKILIPNSILNKPDRLSGSEFELVKKHPLYAFDIFKDSQVMKDVAVYVKYHHEWFNGRGYPEKLSGEQIPFESRLLSIVDSWDAMTSDRIYKKGISEELALGVLVEHSGTQFDPVLVKKWKEFLKKRNLVIENERV